MPTDDKTMKKLKIGMSICWVVVAPTRIKKMALEYNANRLAELTKKEQKCDSEKMETYMLSTTKNTRTIE